MWTIAGVLLFRTSWPSARHTCVRCVGDAQGTRRRRIWYVARPCDRLALYRLFLSLCPRLAPTCHPQFSHCHRLTSLVYSLSLPLDLTPRAFRYVVKARVAAPLLMTNIPARTAAASTLGRTLDDATSGRRRHNIMALRYYATFRLISTSHLINLPGYTPLPMCWDKGRSHHIFPTSLHHETHSTSHAVTIDGVGHSPTWCHKILWSLFFAIFHLCEELGTMLPVHNTRLWRFTTTCHLTPEPHCLTTLCAGVTGMSGRAAKPGVG